MQYISPRGYSSMPEIVKNLIIINVLVFVFMFASEGIRSWMITNLSLWFPLNPRFNVFQPVTSVFMHDESGIAHLAFNMLALWMFGSYLENIIGGKRFLIFYLVCGVGASLFHMGVEYLVYSDLVKGLDHSVVQQIIDTGPGYRYPDEPLMEKINRIVNIRSVGASGAIYGVLVGFAYYNPNARLSFFAIKAKYLVPLLIGASVYGAILNDPNDMTGHLAHLGGGLVGFLMLNIGKLRRLKNRY